MVFTAPTRKFGIFTGRVFRFGASVGGDGVLLDVADPKTLAKALSVTRSYIRSRCHKHNAGWIKSWGV